MASMNNWLAFSLSPQELSSQPDQNHSQNTVSRLGFNSDDISGTDVSGDCFDLTSDSSAPPLNLPPPFSILEAFNRSNQSQDWSLKGLGMNTETGYKASSSNFSMLIGSSCSSQNHEPKLENFLGNHSFSSQEQKLHSTMYNTGSGDYVFSNCSLQLPSDKATNVRTSNGGGGGDDGSSSNINGGNSGSSIGLSMIKTWLRNQPVPTQPENKNNGGGGGGGGAQTLSLSMSTGSQSAGSPLPLLTTTSTGGGSGGESSSSDTNKQQKTTTGHDSQTGAIEAVPRKSIDTFGQRTSIYRGVTRYT